MTEVEPQPSRRPLRIIVVALLGASAALWGASRLTWSKSVDRRPVGDALAVLAHTGAEKMPALVPFALLALAGVAGTIAVGGWWRRALGGVLVLAGITVAVVAITAQGSGQLSDELDFVPWSRILAVVGGVLLVVAGVLLAWFSAQLPRLGASYDAPGAKKPPADPDAELWRALSEGDDPTTGEH